jgi:hypothetical protein
MSVAYRDRRRVELTTHMPFHAAIHVAVPIMKPMKVNTRHARLAPLKARTMPATMPAMIPPMPRLRAKTTRARLPLQIVQRMKFGWAWQRSDHSTVVSTLRNAEG